MECIDRVGIELEGGWKDVFHEDDPTEIYADHSVHLQGYAHTGEVASKPLQLGDALEWMDKHYPHGSDGTCGLHVHVSTKTHADYANLCRTPSYFMRFLLWGRDFIEKMPKEDFDRDLFYQRISGQNRFCELRFIPEKQLALKRKGRGNDVQHNPRYAMLNFAFNVHGTMENRVFPMFREKKTALKAVESWVGMTEEFLLSKKGERSEVVRVSR